MLCFVRGFGLHRHTSKSHLTTIVQVRNITQMFFFFLIFNNALNWHVIEAMTWTLSHAALTWEKMGLFKSGQIN